MFKRKAGLARLPDSLGSQKAFHGKIVAIEAGQLGCKPALVVGSKEVKLARLQQHPQSRTAP